MIDMWNERWKDDVYARASDHGFDSVTDLLRSHPKSSFEELASKIGGNEVPAIQLQWLFRDEAYQNDQSEDYLLSCLIRYLARHVPDGVGRHGDWALNLALGSLSGSMDEKLQSRCSKIIKRFKKEITALPETWFPQENDQLLQRIFKQADE